MRVDLAVERGNATGVDSAVDHEALSEMVQLIARLADILFLKLA